MKNFLTKFFTGQKSEQTQKESSNLGNKLLLSSLPYFIILFIISVLFVFTYKPGTYLSGWDNLHAEFNYSLNIKRAIFSVWQEYQGLGLLAGMAHASDLPREILLYVISPLAPPQIIRYLYHFLMLFLGTAGVYIVLSKMLLKNRAEHVRYAASLLGALVYLFHLGTIQYFYVPFEPYSTFWGFFPMLWFSLLHTLKNPSKKNLLILALLHLLATPLAYVQTIFAVYLIIFITTIIVFLCKKGNISFFQKVKTSILISAIVFAVNSFWILPNGYFFATSVSTTQNAMQNRMATEKFFQMNKSRGTILDYAMLKEFYYDFTDLNDRTGQFDYLMKTWRNHFSNPIPNIIGIFIFLVGLFGIFQKNKYRGYIISIWAITLAVFLSDTPGISLISTTLRELPILNQIFRNPFTKFIVPTVFIFAIGFALGIAAILDFFKKRTITIGISAFVILAIIIYAFPIFRGEFISPQMKTSIPNDYFATFDYFKKQNPNARIMNLPQGSYWGWYYYDWGFHGSGFLWYGIEQPILDRAFDVWSKESETYYWELSYAIKTQNKNLFNKILEEYNVGFILFDDSLTFTDDKNVARPHLNQRNLIEDNPFISKDQQFGSVSIYKVQTSKPNSSIHSFSDLPKIKKNGTFSNQDLAYTENGPYITSEDPDLYYPFTSLFSGRFREEVPLNIEKKESSLIISAPISKGSYSLNLPSFVENEMLIPVEITARIENQILSIQFKTLLPTIKIGDQVFSQSIDLAREEFQIEPDHEGGYILSVNNRDYFSIPNDAKTGDVKIGKTFISHFDLANTIRIYSANPELGFELPASQFKESHRCDEGNEANSSISSISSQNEVKIMAQNAAACSSYNEGFEVSAAGLIGVSFKYKSNTDEYPQYCLFSKNLQSCLNKKDEINSGFTKEYKQLNEYFESTNQADTLNFQLILDATFDEDHNLKKSISYSTVLLSYYPYIGGTSVSLGQSPNAPFTFNLKKDSLVSVEIPVFTSSYSTDSFIQNNIYKKTPLNYDALFKGKYSLSENNNKGKTINLESSNASSYLLLKNQTAVPNTGYLMSVVSKNKTGFPLTANIFTLQDLRTHAYTYVTDSEKLESNYFFIPPIYQFDKGLSVLLGSHSYNRHKTTNEIQAVTMNPIPYNYISQLKIASSKTIKSAIARENESNKKLLYLYEVKNITGNTLTLYQSFDKGWKAYSFDRSSLIHLIFPFFGGERLANHVKINNWANGWNLPDNTKPNRVVVVVYAPQYLEYLGFFLLIVTLGIFLLPLITRKYQLYSRRISEKNLVLKTKLLNKINL